MVEYLTPATSDRDSLQQRDDVLKDRQMCNYNVHHAVRQVPPLQQRTPVYLPDRREEGSILEPPEIGRSYIVQTASGKYRRNRHHICPMPSPPEPVVAAAPTIINPAAPTITDPAPPVVPIPNTHVPQAVTPPASPCPAAPEPGAAAPGVPATDSTGLSRSTETPSGYYTRSHGLVKPPKTFPWIAAARGVSLDTSEIPRLLLYCRTPFLSILGFTFYSACILL